VSWFSDPNCEAAALAEVACVVYAADFDFPSGHVRVHTGVGDLVIGADTYSGLGELGAVSDVPDHSNLSAERWVYRLSLVDVSIVPESEIDDCFGRSVIEYEVWLNPETRATIGTEIRREGTMGRVRRSDGANPMIEISCETRLVILERPDAWRYTGEHQEKFYSGDLGCSLATEIDSVEIIWGGKREPATVHPRLRGRSPG
jgi:hypothetical protein